MSNEKIADTKIYVGNKDEYDEAISKGMKIVCAHRNGASGVSYQSLVGWKGKKSCPKDSPHYLYYQDEGIIALNMIDGNDPKYISDKMIDKAIEFIDQNAENDIFIYCSEGKSRSPSIALMQNQNNFKQKEGRRLSFSDLQLIGEEINYVFDKSIVAKVIGDKKVDYEGRTYKLSPLTREIAEKKGTANDSGSYQGAQYWEFDGIKLVDIM